ncbi:MAG: substrate-binding domain-containing protein [Candidatus Hadarchaeota archaeon]
MNKKFTALVILVALAISALAVSEVVRKGEKKLMIASTTSIYDTGLLDEIADNYRASRSTSLYFLALGTGQSLGHARRGDADAVLVHSPQLENLFLVEGTGGARKIIAYNFFAIVGPPNDPAGIVNMPPLSALQKIAQENRTWVSRGDNSGTHTKEKSLWKSADIQLSQIQGMSWYLESGTGMGQTLLIANERGAYTLADMGTYLKYKTDNLVNLKILVEQGRELLNVYSVMAVNPENHPNVNFSGAVQFIEFMVSENGQKLIGDFGVTKYGRPLFYPAVQLLQENTDSQLASWIRDDAFFENSECPQRYRLGQEQLYQ